MLNFLDTAAGQNPGLLESIFPFLMIGVMILILFFMNRSQKKQERETKAMRDALTIGDEITTIGGIIGKIVAIKDETVLIETGRDKVRIRILKNAVRNVDVKAEDAE